MRTTTIIVQLLRIARLSLAACTTLVTTAWFTVVLLRVPGESGWPVLQLAAASLVIAIGVLTWLSLRASPAALPLVVGGLLLVILGSAALIWSIHLGITTSDFEYWAMLLHVLIGSQGVTIVLSLYLEACRSFACEKVESTGLTEDWKSTLARSEVDLFDRLSQPSATSNAVMLRVWRLNSTPTRWIGSPLPRYLAA